LKTGQTAFLETITKQHQTDTKVLWT